MKYFLDRKGVTTQRMAGKSGAGHIEIAMATEHLDPAGDIYQQMFAFGYVCVLETNETVMVDAPHALTARQKKFLAEKAAAKKLVINDALFIETRG